MKAKILSLMTLSILALVLTLGLASATLNFDSPTLTETIVDGEVSSIAVNFNLTSDVIGTLVWTATTPTVGVLNLPSDTSISAETKSFSATLSGIPTNSRGTITSTITVNDGTGAVNLDVVITVNAPDYESCELSSINEDKLTLNVDIKNTGEGEDEEWLPLDVIEIEVELENDKNLDGDGDLNDVLFEIGLFEKGSASTTNYMEDMIWISSDEEEYEVGDVDEDEKESHIFKFRIDPGEIDDGTYILMVKAYPDGDEESTCLDYSDDLDMAYYTEIKVNKEGDVEKMVVVDVDSLPTPIRAACGDSVMLDIDVWNIGDEDFVDQVKINLFNTELGLNVEEVIEGDLDQGDRAQTSFIFDVPEGIEEKQYTLEMRTHYDYDEDDDEYDEYSDDTFKVYLDVEGNCALSQALVSAALESGGKAGKELVVRATITNTGNKATTYLVNAFGYAEWASAVSVEPSTLILEAGQSADVLITLNVNRDASGEKLFNIEVVSEGELVVSQPLSVSVEKALGGDLFGDNGVLTALIIGIAIILVIIIVVLAIRVARR